MRQLEYMASAPLPMPWMTQKLAEVLIRALHLIGKTSIFPETSHFYGVAPDESTETERQQRESFMKPKWNNYEFTMYLSRITAFHGIAVKWFLKVYWLLPLSTDDSFAEHKTLLIFVDKTVMPDLPNSRVLLGHTKICACAIEGWASTRRSLSLDWHSLYTTIHGIK